MIAWLKRSWRFFLDILGAASLGIVGALLLMKYRARNASAVRQTESLADENARRARAQADEAQREADKMASAQEAEVLDRAMKEASHAASVGDLAGYLKSRPK